MENATKALLIAAAVLVAILIISLGLVVYNMAAEAMGSVNLTQQEIQAHNEQFTRYNGTQKGTACNALLTTVLNSNILLDDDSKSKEVTVYKDEAKTKAVLEPTATKITERFDTGKTYTVSTEQDATTGLVTSITVIEKGTSGTGGTGGN